MASRGVCNQIRNAVGWRSEPASLQQRIKIADRAFLGGHILDVINQLVGKVGLFQISNYPFARHCRRFTFDQDTAGTELHKHIGTLAQVQRRIISGINRLQTEGGSGASVKQLKIYVHPVNYDRLTGDDADLVQEIERSYGVTLSFSSNEAYHVENFKVLDEASGKEIF